MIQPISLLLCALGGEGGGVLTEWLVEAARHAGYPVQATSIPGVAQRTGATTYYLEIFPVPLADLGSKRPVLGLYPVPGRLDALVSSELLETARQIGHGLTASDRTVVLTSSARALTTQEKMQLGDGRREAQELLAIVRQNSRAHHVLDMAQLTREAGTVVSAVMLGCIAGSELLPMARADYEHVLSGSGAGSAASLRGFTLGLDAIRAQREQVLFMDELWSGVPPAQAGSPVLAADVAALFPAALHELIALGHARLCEYQSAVYARRYVDRLQRILLAEQASDPGGLHGHAVTREVARWLALWMAFDDIVRVADLKSRAGRWQRVRGEVKAGAGDVLRIYDHFKPGIPEFSALLPAGVARRLQGWEQRRLAQGKSPLALPLKIGTHSVLGMVVLRLLASFKWLRPHGSRFATEQALIEQWLTAVADSTRRHWGGGFEVAQCGRLIKGYGSTNERGKDNLLHVIEHLAKAPHFPREEARVQAIAAARSAALTDDAGRALDQTLMQHGAPARVVKPQPIRWVKNPHLSKSR